MVFRVIITVQAVFKTAFQRILFDGGQCQVDSAANPAYFMNVAVYKTATSQSYIP